MIKSLLLLFSLILLQMDLNLDDDGFTHPYYSHEMASRLGIFFFIKFFFLLPASHEFAVR